MASLTEDSFLISSSTDSSTDLLDEDMFEEFNIKPRNPSNRVNSMSRRNSTVSFDVSSPFQTPEDNGELLRFAVATALGIDASSLPTPFRESQNDNDSSSIYSDSSDPQYVRDGAMLIRKSSASSTSVYSSPTDINEWRKSMGTSIEERITSTMASVLNLDTESLRFDESFVDLGGNHRKARELRAKCMDEGLVIKTKDIMNCKTIAELETYVVPLNPSGYSENKVSTTTVSPLKLASLENPMSSTQQRALQSEGPPAIPPKAPARYTASQSHLKIRPSRRRYNQVEQVLTSHGDISRAVMLKPKAGPFEDQLVAFVTLAGYLAEGPNDCEVKLHNPCRTSQLPSIRKAVESRVPPGLAPRVWVVLEKMPVDDAGKNNRRKLQTWIQNANDELYHQILSADSKTKLKLLIAGGVLQKPPLTQLAALATSNVSQSRGPSGTANMTFDLSPMQRLYFHTPMGSDYRQRKIKNGNYRFNQSMLFRLRQNLIVDDIRAAVEALVGHHHMLRCRFRRNESSWCQLVESDISSSYHFSHHSTKTHAEVEEVIRAAQGLIDIETGPVFAAHHFRTSDGSQVLYMIAHHLVVDLKSWRIIIDDLGALLTSGCLVSGRNLSFKEWSLYERSRTQGAEHSFNIPEGNSQYWGVDSASNTYGNIVAFSFTLGQDVTSVLEENCRELRMDTVDIFMAALVLSFAQTFRDRLVPTLWNQENERSVSDTDRDVSGTVGWFTSLYPLAMEVSSADDFLTVLNHVKDSRRANSRRGPSQFARNLIDSSSALSFVSSHCPLELVFTHPSTMQNVQSQDSLLEQIPVPGKMLASETSDIGRNVGRIAIFETSISVDQGETKFKLLCHRDVAHQERVRNWFRGYETIVRKTINELQVESLALPSSNIPRMEITDEGFGRLNTAILPRLGLNLSDIEAIYPVTIIQQNILTNQSLVSGSSNAQMIHDFDTSDGPVDISRICAAWHKVTEKHSALRTVFSQAASKNGLYDQLILRSHSPSMLFLESDSVDDAMMSLKNLPLLSLNEGIPWHRLVVCKVAGKTLLKLETSQALCDVASMAILFRELEQAYSDDQSSRGSEVSRFEYMKCLKVTACSIEFWREHLRGARPCQFPKLISQQPVPSKWETTSINLNVSSERLKTFAKDYKINVSTILQIAWGLLLRTYTGTNNVCFGFRVSGRDLPVEGLDHAVGSFSMVLPSRLAIPPGESIARLLLDTEDQRRRMLDHQHVPLTRIEHELKIKGGRLFNTCLSFGYEYFSDDVSTNTNCHHVRTEQASESDLNIDVYFHDGNVTLDIGYRILTSEQANTVACAFGGAIEAIIDVPASTVREIDLFSMRDHKQILAWNSMPRVDVSKENVHQLIAKQALLNPDIEAVCSWDGSLSYYDLHRLSRVLARHLFASGLKPQTPVPVIVDKSRWAVVAMLAVLYTGAILVPVDAEMVSSFAWVIKTVIPSFMLVSDHVQRHIDGLSTKVIVVNERTISAMSAQMVDMILPQPSLHDIACILFSSGSSGNAKGISYSHAALATACAGQGSTLLINPSSRVMQISSYSVDIALSEVFTTLVNGGCVCIPSSAERIVDFSGAAKRMRVNWTYLTPTLSRKVDTENLPDISVVCFRTRNLDSDVYITWINKTAKVLLVYGCPEACPLGLSTTELTLSKTSQCFGSPFCGNFWIVSPEDNNRLMPVGALGELVIGGPTLASWFNVSDTNIKAWISKSKSRARSLLEKSGSHLFKTRHYVRYLEDGEIEFISDGSEETTIDGRKFRHSEVEPKLRQCLGSGVDVVVETIAFNDPNSAPILAAFVELGDNILQGSEDLLSLTRTTRERLYLSKKMADMVLRETLPSYMIPSAYIPVKRMPLTATLDIDRLELQRMIAGYSRKQLLGLAEVSNPTVQDASFKPLPLTQVERQMRTIWAYVLGIEEDSIKAGDGFLSLGGDAVLAHDLIVECKQRGISISIIDVLRDVPLAELCKGVVMAEVFPTAVQDARSVQPSRPDSFVDEAIVPRLGSDRSVIEDVAETSYIQTMFVESGMLQSRGNVDYLTINITGSLDWRKLETACFILTKAHPILRTAFVSHGRQLYQTVLRSYRPDFMRFQCQSWRLGNLAAKIIKREQLKPADFRRPITKFSYLDAGKSSMLLIRLSRAQYDDYSLPVLTQDLSRFYGLSCGDQVVPRPGFCEVVRASQFTYPNHASEYWSALLSGATMTQIVSQPSPASISSNSITIRQQISVGSLQNLGIPFETILKGAWSIVLSNLSGTDDVVFGQLIEGKNLSLPTGLPDISDVVGPIGNIMPVRTRLPDTPTTPYEYFRYIQSQHVASVPYENMQASDIVQKCTPWPSWSRFSTVVCHRSQIEDYKSTNFIIGTACCKLGCVESNHQESDIFIRSTALGASNVDISLMFCEKRLPLYFADDVLKMLCSIITLLTSSFVMEPIVLKGLGDNYSTSRIPLPTPKRELGVLSTIESVDPDLARGVHTIISAAWDTVLEAHSLKVPDIRSVPFYEIWGALIPAAELARYYTENIHSVLGIEGTNFTMEEIIDHPTMMQQYELIIAKKHAPQIGRSRSPMLIGRQSAWGKGIRRLGGIPNSTNATSGRYPIGNHHKHKGSGGSASLASMTMGSSQSDEELGEDIPLGSSAPWTKKPAIKTYDTKATKKGASLLGKMMIPAISG
ncbi:uncharacterized protein F4807DRAFT_331715 [Annulohypoxylon truncatum]|uniref:uncharacterized protein n=1 Tax=Annulohypoxylon truncatum TaxID=327061 RepID=UPI00200883B7|nr:uncharacterized protein F4807DRAFT_331715 [Annulohypoxylon truncatum]KAI1204509.1 hypothetical protein F4807DRAFT_331715 [Annulohypoxylon truncatum]